MVAIGVLDGYDGWNLDDVKAVRLLEILLSEHHFVTRMLPVCYRVITTICYG